MRVQPANFDPRARDLRSACAEGRVTRAVVAVSAAQHSAAQQQADQHSAQLQKAALIGKAAQTKMLRSAPHTGRVLHAGSAAPLVDVFTSERCAGQNRPRDED